MRMNNQVKPTTTTPTTMLSDQGNGKRLKQDGVNLASTTFFLNLFGILIHFLVPFKAL